MSANSIGTPTILVVDDSPVMQSLIKRTLEASYQVSVVSSAMDALSILGDIKVSLILLDVSMPEIDGLELCRTLRSLPIYKDLPVVMLTGRDGIFDKVQGHLAGATEYLTKPFDKDELLEVVKKYTTADLGNLKGQMQS